uniref:Odorant-binding protein 25 n=1 Tax=Encarsia formosa TaxID=32400 RepID=A0A514TTY0_ENCFO|nr:odorant-binding protein 25 [Encarsia formosa]
MKASILAVCFLLFAVCIHGEFQYRVPFSPFRQCLNETGIDREEYMSLVRNNDLQVGCTIACILEKRHQMIDGIIQSEVIINTLKNIPRSMGYNEKLFNYDYVESCIAEAGLAAKNKCEKALLYHRCLFYVPPPDANRNIQRV